MNATSTDLATIREFLALPSGSLPRADYVGESGILHPWSALRCAVSKDWEKQEEAEGCGAIRLAADRDGWREGKIVTL